LREAIDFDHVGRVELDAETNRLDGNAHGSRSSQELVGIALPRGGSGLT
jgi:hypothetical protein